MRIVLVMWCLACCGLASGCGYSTVEVETESVQPAGASAKKMLENIAQTGELTSEVMSIQEELEKLKSTDEAKATALLGDLNALQAMTSPQQIKQKAKEMADKL
jgi:DNA-directed RNA polymerase subunit F